MRRAVIGNVLVQRTRLVACLEDALHGIGCDGTEASCMPQRLVDILGRVTLAEQEDTGGRRCSNGELALR